MMDEVEREKRQLALKIEELDAAAQSLNQHDSWLQQSQAQLKADESRVAEKLAQVRVAMTQHS